ncbi:hypothetical protein [Haloarchaeobius litoreus]|uniref:DUF4229 domain-containing protein n=1 Tax=Haloarchaeobius litoreus TaxID=755306 RepID=A0ABD6DL16_9EURY|nr:hypothetical protein [Haloarchaeobius litoreus]
MERTTLNALLLSIGAITVVYSFITATLLLGVVVILFLLAVSLFHRLVVAVERLADNVGRLEAATGDGGRSGSGTRTSDRRSGGADWDDDDHPPAEERDPDELFE